MFCIVFILITSKNINSQAKIHQKLCQSITAFETFTPLHHLLDLTENKDSDKFKAGITICNTSNDDQLPNHRVLNLLQLRLPRLCLKDRYFFVLS